MLPVIDISLSKVLECHAPSEFFQLCFHLPGIGLSLTFRSLLVAGTVVIQIYLTRLGAGEIRIELLCDICDIHRWIYEKLLQDPEAIVLAEFLSRNHRCKCSRVVSEQDLVG